MPYFTQSVIVHGLMIPPANHGLQGFGFCPHTSGRQVSSAGWHGLAAVKVTFKIYNSYHCLVKDIICLLWAWSVNILCLVGSNQIVGMHHKATGLVQNLMLMAVLWWWWRIRLCILDGLWYLLGTQTNLLIVINVLLPKSSTIRHGQMDSV